LSFLKVYDDDDLPKLLCPTCVGLLTTFETFKEACAQSVDTIRKLVVANLKEEPIEEIVLAEALEPIWKVDNKPETKRLLVSKRPICALCGLTFASMKSIRAHIKLELKRARKKEHGDMDPVVQKAPKTKQEKEMKPQLYCTHEGCGRLLQNQKNLDKHLKLHENDKVSSHFVLSPNGFLTN
jgi:hypothetical protein